MYMIVNLLIAIIICGTVIHVTHEVCDAFGPNLRDAGDVLEIPDGADDDNEHTTNFDDIIAAIYGREEGNE